jgi:hypothetical protein
VDVVVVPVVVVDPVVEVDVDEPELEVVVPVVDVLVVGVAVTVTVSVTVRTTIRTFAFGQAPFLSPARRCAGTAAFATLIVTSFFDAVRWHIVTLLDFLNTWGPASATAARRPAANRAPSEASNFMDITPRSV